MQCWFVYMVRCRDDSLYTGITTDLQRRINEHNQGNTKSGAKFTRSRQPVTLVYQEPATNRSEATRREMAIKSLNRQQKLALINDNAINRINHSDKPAG